MDDPYESSLEQLDGHAWGLPDPGATGLMERVHRLRTVKLRDLSIEDLSTLLGHGGEEWIVPLALDILHDDPLVGAFYPGHLLTDVLQVPPGYWERSPLELARLSLIRGLVLDLRTDIDTLLNDPRWPSDIRRTLTERT